MSAAIAGPPSPENASRLPAMVVMRLGVAVLGGGALGSSPQETGAATQTSAAHNLNRIL
ncbi:MAG: hypothetical protein ACREBE_26645 [bacterium]